MTQPAWAGMIETPPTKYKDAENQTQPAWAGMIETPNRSRGAASL